MSIGIWVETFCLDSCLTEGFPLYVRPPSFYSVLLPGQKLLPQESDATLWFGQQGKPCGYRFEPLLYIDKFCWKLYKWFMKPLHYSKTFVATYLTILILTPRVSSKPPNLGHDQGPHHIDSVDLIVRGACTCHSVYQPSSPYGQPIGTRLVFYSMIILLSSFAWISIL